MNSTGEAVRNSRSVLGSRGDWTRSSKHGRRQNGLSGSVDRCGPCGNLYALIRIVLTSV